MTKYLFNLVQFEPKEVSQNQCIWCEQANKKNSAHILSKQLLKTNLASNILKHSVCITCNSLFGKEIEDWFFKYSPLGTWKQQFFYNEQGPLKHLKFLPNFIWMNEINDWVITNYNNVDELIGIQAILGVDGGLTFINYSNSKALGLLEMPSILEFFKTFIINANYTLYVEKKLPENFGPRCFLYKSKLIIVARKEEDIPKLIEKVKSTEFNDDNDNTDAITASEFDFKNHFVHYKWSFSKYLKWSSKIAFEFLFLIKPELIFNPEFISLKEAMIDSKSYVNDDIHTIPYVNGKGYEINRFAPNGWVAMFLKINDKGIRLPTFETVSQNSHKIFIYELNGYLLCTIKIFNIEQSQIILAQGIKLDLIYYIEYDYLADRLKFYHTSRSIFNKSSPQKSLSEVSSRIFNLQ